MSRQIYHVQVVDPETGHEDSIRVEADSEEAAKAVLTGMGRIVGQSRLAEVMADAAACVTRPPIEWTLRSIALAVLVVVSMIALERAQQPPPFDLRLDGMADGYRFKSDNAVGATANASELLLESSRRIEWIVLAGSFFIALSVLSNRK